MKRYNLVVLETSEKHWVQAGQQRLASGELLLYSGYEKENAPHTQGVALTIIKASFKTKKEGITINDIQCYAHTKDCNEDVEDQFYNRLQSIVEKCSTKDLTILMVDLNAKVGMNNTGYEYIMGSHGLGEMNGNGERFTNLYAFNKLAIGGTKFSHKRIHTDTWISLDHNA
ncbi:unnamed protein product [Schistosoma margrebowiei]|uniref:Uncharacterized protein n=1 Tax=Schistosoma margrebowiei TaxID=48269 RepID=A0A183MQR4_9TREM|nr:unnamed protein product [Schistosoma margrebowiei]